MMQILETFPCEVDCRDGFDGTKFYKQRRVTYQYQVQCEDRECGKLVLATIPLETALSANLEMPFTAEQMQVRPCANLGWDTLYFNSEATNDKGNALFAVVALDTKKRTAIVTLTVTELVQDSLLPA